MLDLGADACVEIPVDLREILAILKAVLRREEKLQCVRTAMEPCCIEHKEMFIDPLRRKVVMRGQVIALTQKEFDILHLLAKNSGKVFTKEQIYSAVWRESVAVGTSIVRDHISAMRRKLGLLAEDCEYIETVFRVGYRFAER